MCPNIVCVINILLATIKWRANNVNAEQKPNARKERRRERKKNTRRKKNESAVCSHDCCLCHTAFYHSSHLYHFWFRCCAIVCVRYTNIACGLTIPTIYQFQFVGFLLWAARIRFICWLIKYYEPLTFEVSPVHCLKECETRNVEIAESLHHMHAERERWKEYTMKMSQ